MADSPHPSCYLYKRGRYALKRRFPTHGSGEITEQTHFGGPTQTKLNALSHQTNPFRPPNGSPPCGERRSEGVGGVISELLWKRSWKHCLRRTGTMPGGSKTGVFQTDPRPKFGKGISLGRQNSNPRDPRKFAEFVRFTGAGPRPISVVLYFH